MATITKKDLIDRIAERSSNKRVVVKRIIQSFLDEIVDELGEGNRLEFRDFGVFECRPQRARIARNPKTSEPVEVPAKKTVKFKVGRMMKMKLQANAGATGAAFRSARAWSTSRLTIRPPGPLPVRVLMSRS